MANVIRGKKNIAEATGLVPYPVARDNTRPEKGHDYWCSYWGYPWHCENVTDDQSGFAIITEKQGNKTNEHRTLLTKNDFELLPFAYDGHSDIKKVTLTGAEWYILVNNGTVDSPPMKEDLQRSLEFGLSPYRLYSIAYSRARSSYYLKKAA